ncbi:hypothetical protein DUI87_18331 [Hirundo rustica rustica]|uniref:Uncharacterized protein n=1 Tax=Hirundo rustica rustica TaxID=333673 RepID=A0A3M0JWB5_HIRRU|nr:hypothetical protein DUI87_18331 [Hirundo rustica rustica]
MAVHSGAQIHLQLMEDPTLEQVDVPKGVCGPWEACAGAGLLVGSVTPQEDPCWNSLFPRDCTPWMGSYTGAVCEDGQPRGRTRTGEDHGEMSPMGGMPRWSRGRV